MLIDEKSTNIGLFSNLLDIKPKKRYNKQEK